MKNQILLIICLLASVVANAQIEATNASGCNCYNFSVDPATQYSDFYNASNPQDPGYSYLWIWGDGQHTEATSAVTEHCFNGSSTNFDVVLHLTPRKKEEIPHVMGYSNFPDPVVSPGINQISVCSSNIYRTTLTQMTLNREPKPGHQFIVIVQAKSCAAATEFTLKFAEQYLNVFDDAGWTRSGDLLTYTQPANEYKNHYLIFECHEDVYEPTEIDFYLNQIAQGNTTVSTNDEPGKPNDSLKRNDLCNENFILPATIIGGPYDPNILSPSLGKDLEDCNIGGKTIRYTLQFQNEGDMETKGVKLVLNLDNNLDPNLRVVNVKNVQHLNWPAAPSTITSDKCSYELRQGASTFLKEIICNNMKLQPLKAGNVSNSMGYVTFDVDVPSGFNLTSGQQLISIAEVYFMDSDSSYLDPVKTNKAITSCKVKCNSWLDNLLCWIKCWHKWIIGILFLSFLWCFFGKWRARKHK